MSDSSESENTKDRNLTEIANLLRRITRRFLFTLLEVILMICVYPTRGQHAALILDMKKADAYNAKGKSCCNKEPGY